MGVADESRDAPTGRVPARVLQQWCERLSDRIRAALEAGDLERARRLAVEGDGEARSLEKEYALMYKGLGITIRVLLGLLRELGSRVTGSPGAERALTSLLSRFRGDMIAALRRACPEDAGVAALDQAAVTAGPSRLEAELDATTLLLGTAERSFMSEQARTAGLAVGAMEAGDAGRARALVDRKEREQYVPLHDRLVRFMAE
ncbi:MAG TPA: hypothetical protein VFN71_00035, partial [Methylomirabilota bacterium]|nr:hypothetical protein [Methylomirabilota bacterium]